MREVQIRSERLITSMAVVLTLVITLALVATPPAQAQTFTLLYTFTGGADGGFPYAGLVQDTAGNLYGTTSQGGSGLFDCPTGCGVVFKLDSAGNETVLHSFGKTGTDGEYPMYGSLFRDGAGNLHGTTGFGGAHGSGTIFRVDTTGKETISSFRGAAKGGFPYAGLVPDAAGNVYGTTFFGGSGCPPYGCGTVFKVNSAGKETVLYSFTGKPDAEYPYAGLVRDSAGNLYGTTINGGATGWGTVFKVNSTGKETVLYSFTGGADGGNPYGTLLGDRAGNLYGTTASGGTSGSGTVFKVSSSGAETVLYGFTGGVDGGNPCANLVRDRTGNLYGTTPYGGTSGNGTVFKVSPSGMETVLYSFSGGTDGAQPYDGLVRDTAGNLYGTALGGNGPGYYGTVWKLTP